MKRYVVTKTETSMMIVYAGSEEDAEHDARANPEFDFIDEEYSAKEVGD